MEKKINKFLIISEAIVLLSAGMLTVSGVPAASIGDFVWNDLNVNGIQETGEPGIADVIVELYKCDDVLVASTTTDVNGYYLFIVSIPGDYYVKFVPPLGYVFTLQNQGADDIADSDADHTTGVTICTDLEYGEDLTWDAGLYEPPCTGSIGDYVWNDGNRNGIQDSNEMGIDGVEVLLTDSAGNVQTVTTFTGGPNNAPGYYLFEDLCAGDYTVQVNPATVPAGMNPTIINAPGSTSENDSDNSAGTAVNLPQDNSEDLTIDFGFFQDEIIGTGTPGYWKNHPEAWPVDEITIGSILHPKADAIEFIKHPTKRDKTFTMFQALVAAKLNVLMDAESSCIDETIDAADAWMEVHPVDSGVSGSSDAWIEGEPLSLLLDDYNNGRLCAPHRDTLEDD